MKTLFTLLALCAGVASHAQMATVQAEFNNFRWMTALNGSMFFDQANNMPGFEVPINSGNHTLFAANLWIGGRNTENNLLHLTAERYCQSHGCQFGPGPLRLDGTPGEWSLAASPYNRFWLVSKDQVETHLAYHNCANDTDCDAQALFPEGYEPPADFVSWPAMGYSDDGFAPYLAPFFDYDGDGIYDANSGDHPLFCGDMAVYSITNDLSNRPETTFWAPGLGVEVHTQYYAFDAEEAELFNTLFVQQRIINRSSETYQDTYLGVWNDFDLGNYIDDYIATDVQHSMVYVYNGTSFDEGSLSGPGYGDDLPMFGMRILGGPYKDANGEDDAPLYPTFNTYANQGPGWGDGIVDNERLGLAASLYHASFAAIPVPTQEPVFPLDFYNYMLGVWKDGTPMSVGGLGYNPLVMNTITTYKFPGLSDPLLAGTNGIDPNFPDPDGWSEISSGNPPGDRRMLASSGPFTFGPGEEQYLDYAYIFARDSHEPGVDVLETLRSYSDAITGMECGPLPQIVMSTRNATAESLEFRLFPNPASNALTLQSSEPAPGHYTMYDLLGKVVIQGNTIGARTELSIAHLPKGLYLLRYETAGRAAVSKLVVE